MNTKTRKKVTNKRMPKKTNSKKTFYGLMHKANLGAIDSKEGAIFISNCKSDHPNHAINSCAMDLGDNGMKDQILIKIEVIGKPVVKTTREITIKK